MSDLVFIPLRVPKKQKAIIVAIATDKGISYAEYVRRIIDKHIKEERKDPEINKIIESISLYSSKRS